MAERLQQQHPRLQEYKDMHAVGKTNNNDELERIVRAAATVADRLDAPVADFHEAAVEVNCFIRQLTTLIVDHSVI